MATSAAPAALTALIEILGNVSADPVLAGATVLDGPSSTNITAKNLLYIGWQPGGESAVTIEQDFNAAGARTKDERFDIACYAESRGGTKDIAVRRTVVFDMVAGVENELRATAAEPDRPTLNGTVLWAHLSVGNLSQAQTDSGALAGLAFTIRCRARI